MGLVEMTFNYMNGIW